VRAPRRRGKGKREGELCAEVGGGGLVAASGSLRKAGAEESEIVEMKGKRGKE